MSRRVVNVTCADLVGFNLILHCSSEFWSRLGWCKGKIAAAARPEGYGRSRFVALLVPYPGKRRYEWPALSCGRFIPLTH